jgi:hypothetical protein
MDEARTEALIQKSEDLEAKLDKSILDDLIRSDKRHYRIINILTVVCTVLALSIAGLAYAIVRINVNARGLARIEDLCERANHDKAGEAELWKAIFDFPPRPDITQAQKDLAERLKAIVKSNTTPEDCNVL